MVLREGLSDPLEGPVRDEGTPGKVKVRQLPEVVVSNEKPVARDV